MIAQEKLVPQLQQENYGEAIYDTVVALGDKIPIINQTNTSPRGFYLYESDLGSTPQSNWWSWLTTDFYGLPIWVIILLALIGVAAPIFRGRTSRGRRSGGGGSSGKW